MQPINGLWRVWAAMTVLLFPFLGRAQYDMGVVNGNYAGIRGSLINPAAIADPKFKLDVNVLSGGVLFDNNFLYVPKGAVPAFGFGAIIRGIIHTDKYDTYYNPANPNKLYNVTLSAEILGPSFSLALPNRQVVGLTVVNRLSAVVRDIPGATGQNAFDYLRNHSLWYRDLSDQTTRLNGMNWMEWGLHYAAVLSDDGTDQWKAGITLKYMEGIAGAYAKNTHLVYRIDDSSHLIFAGGVDYGRTDYDSYRHAGGLHNPGHGHGFGADLGVQYSHEKTLTIGLSLMDIGSIRFDRDAAAFHLETTGADFVNFGQAHLKSNLAVDRALSAVFYAGDSSRSLVANVFRMGLPTALSLQADWRVQDHYFVNATIVKGFGHGGGQGAVQPDIYAVTPRYETQWWDVSLPLSLLYYGQWRPRIGIAARLWYVYFGGDAPFSLLALGRLQGVDFYAGVRYYIFNKSK